MMEREKCQWNGVKKTNSNRQNDGNTDRKNDKSEKNGRKSTEGE